MSNNTYIYLLVAALTIFAIRALPLTLIQKECFHCVDSDTGG